jgi:hypothetical protein
MGKGDAGLHIIGSYGKGEGCCLLVYLILIKVNIPQLARVRNNYILRPTKENVVQRVTDGSARINN